MSSHSSSRASQEARTNAEQVLHDAEGPQESTFRMVALVSTYGGM